MRIEVLLAAATGFHVCRVEGGIVEGAVFRVGIVEDGVLQAFADAAFVLAARGKLCLDGQGVEGDEEEREMHLELWR